MPLTTTWTRCSVSKCGCAFSSLTRPWVAQRVWPMPVVAARTATAVPPSPSLARRHGLEQVLRGCRRRARTRSRRLRSARSRPSHSRGTRASSGRRGGDPARAACRRSRRCRTCGEGSERSRWPASVAVLTHGTCAGALAGSREARSTTATSRARRRRRPRRRSAPRPSRARAARCRSGARARARGPRARRCSRVGGLRDARRRAIAASRSATRTLTRRWGSLRIASRSARSPPRSASSVSSALAMPSPVGRRSRVDDVARLLAAERPSRASRSASST